jgi:hypothetical protein
MEPFAKFFMLLSMGCVTALAVYTMARTVRAEPLSSDDEE